MRCRGLIILFGGVDMTSDLGPPEVVSAQLVLGVDGLESCPLSTLLLRAVMGVARLYVPRSLQVGSGQMLGWSC